jgi:tetratricopeptide (TPR) repeat protein
MRRLPRAALAAAAVLAAGAAVFLVFRLRAPSPSRLEETIAALDSALAAGSLPTAREELQSLQVMPSEEQGQLRLLKRALQLGSLSGDYHVLAELGEKLQAAGGKGIPVRTVTAYAMMRVGRLSDAERILPRRTLRKDIGDPLSGELALRRGEAWTGSDGVTTALFRLTRISPPGDFASAASRTGNARLLLDAALREMESGNRARASSIVSADLGGAEFDEPGGMILYDSGNVPAAIERLARRARPGRADLAFVLADAWAALGRDARSEAALRIGVPLAPQLTWTSYANLAYFALGKGDAVRASRWVDDGLAFFPGSRDLLLARARLDTRRGDPAPAVEVLTKLVDAHPADGEAALLLLDLQSSGASPEQHRGRLWKLFNRNPADRDVFLSLASALTSAHDWRGVAVAIRQHEEARGLWDAQTLVLQGTAESMGGDDARAEETFLRAASMTSDGVARYDRALVLFRQGRRHAALEELAVAVQEYSQAGDPARRREVLSRMEMIGGSARMLDGDVAGARAALARALALDPGNLRAALTLRKLEAGGQ